MYCSTSDLPRLCNENTKLHFNPVVFNIIRVQQAKYRSSFTSQLENLYLDLQMNCKYKVYHKHVNGKENENQCRPSIMSHKILVNSSKLNPQCLCPFLSATILKILDEILISHKCIYDLERKKVNKIPHLSFTLKYHRKMCYLHF